MKKVKIGGQKEKLPKMKEDMFWRSLGTWDYKSDGIKQLKYELVSIEDIGPSVKMINVKF